MNEKFQNRYRIPSNRLRGWDYSGNGHYFVTIVTAGRENLFGDIQNGEMILNEMGQIVYDEFFKSFEIRNELFLGAFVLMPNHLHTIVMLDKPHCEIIETSDGNEEMHGNKIVETHGRASLPTTPTFQRKPQSISSFVAGFKSSTVLRIDEWIDSNGLHLKKYNRLNPLWQANYHDHIIRNEKEYKNIEQYIEANPSNWGSDTLNGIPVQPNNSIM